MDCEKFMHDHKFEALKQARLIDDNIGEIKRKTALMEELTEKIRVANEEIDATKKALAEAQGVRDQEAHEYAEADADDNKAKGLVRKAITVLTSTHRDVGRKNEHSAVVQMMEAITVDIQKD